MGQVVTSPELSVFAGRRVFITGHTGFKGSWLTYLLQQAGAEVTGYALAPEPENCHFNQLELADSIQHIIGDTRDLAHLKQAIDDCQPEVVFHLAAQPLVRAAYDDPLLTFETNTMGSCNLLECVRHCEAVRSLVYITSDKCYENVNWVWGYRENDRVGGRDPYSASKGAAEVIFSSYLRSFFEHMPHLGAASARAGNVIGGGDWADNRIVPDCVRAIAADEPITLRHPNATRPWQHVLEPLSGYLMLAVRLLDEPKRFSGAWNFGPQSRHVRTVEQVAGAMVEHLGRGRVIAETPPPTQHEDQLLQLNCDKAHQQLGWRPRWDVPQAIEETARWYKAVVINEEDARSITRKQIEEFFAVSTA